MRYAIPDRSQMRLPLFILVILSSVILAFHISQVLPKGGVWEDHLAAGLLFWKGSIPELPAYPMWGYSLLSGVLKEYIIFFQGILVILVCAYWYKSILRLSATADYSGKLAKILINPVFAAAALLPFIFLGLSYFSNSMAYILSFSGMWLLYIAVEKEKERAIRYSTISGLLIGLGFNFRSEVIMLGALSFFAILIYGIIAQRKRYYFRIALMFVIPLFLLTLPWMAYTNFTLKQPLISSTNGGAVAYLGLGVLPDNPWGVVDSDDFAAKVANSNALGSPWSYDANNFFKQKYLQSIKENPSSFAERVVVGWKQMLTQGLYFPSFRRLVSLENNRDEILIDYINEKKKLAFGFNVNEKQWEEYRLLGINSNDLSFRHYAIIMLEYLLRFIYLAFFLMLLGVSFFLSLKTKFTNFISIIFLIHMFFLLFIAGFIHTLPRHTTLLLPISLSTVIVLTYQLASKKTGESKGASSGNGLPGGLMQT